jgi:hypothetical protein
MVQKEKKTVQEQVKEALDGRTQRWLSFSIRVPESDLSKKMKGKSEFTQDEIDSINTLLNSQIKLS